MEEIVIAGMSIRRAQDYLVGAGYRRAEHARADFVDLLDQATARHRTCAHCGAKGLRCERWDASFARCVLLVCAACGKVDEL